MAASATGHVNIRDDIDAAIAHLRARDSVLAGLIERVGPYPLRPVRSPFEVMLRTIVSQQLSTHAADTIYGRLARAMGPPRPEHVLALSDDTLRACGLSRAKMAYVRNVAAAFGGANHTRRSFSALDDAAVIERLTAIKGVGEWSAHMFLIFALHRADVFPIGDLGLRNSMMRHYRLRANTHVRRLHTIADEWRPYRSVGTLYMWQGYDSD
jgi:DNA-3-methyladenine glycosylase II